MIKAYKYKLSPSEEQKSTLSQFFGCARFIYNWGLNQKVSEYKNTKKSIGYIQLANQLTQLKQNEDYKWLNDTPVVCLQQSLRCLDNAFTRFFKLKKGFPKFKSKKDRKNSVKFITNVHFDFDNWKVKVPRIGWINICKNKPFDKNTVKQGTLAITKDNCNDYWCTILIDDMQPNVLKAKVSRETAVGIDMGIAHFATLSDGRKFNNPHFGEKYSKRLKALQKAHAKKQNGSKNKERSRIKIAKLQRHIANQRLDFCHKLSAYLVRHYDTICMEDLNIEGMMQNHHLASAIQQCAWRTFRDLLTYKCDFYGKNILLIGRFEPSSKLCSVCGRKNDNLTLNDRAWTCPHCGTEHDRDVNAAINIMDMGLHPQSMVANSAREKDNSC